MTMPATGIRAGADDSNNTVLRPAVGVAVLQCCGVLDELDVVIGNGIVLRRLLFST